MIPQQDRTGKSLKGSIVVVVVVNWARLSIFMFCFSRLSKLTFTVQDNKIRAEQKDNDQDFTFKRLTPVFVLSLFREMQIPFWPLSCNEAAQ